MGIQRTSPLRLVQISQARKKREPFAAIPYADGIEFGCSPNLALPDKANSPFAGSASQLVSTKHGAINLDVVPLDLNLSQDTTVEHGSDVSSSQSTGGVPSPSPATFMHTKPGCNVSAPTLGRSFVSIGATRRLDSTGPSGVIKSSIYTHSSLSRSLPHISTLFQPPSRISNSIPQPTSTNDQTIAILDKQVRANALKCKLNGTPHLNRF